MRLEITKIDKIPGPSGVGVYRKNGTDEVYQLMYLEDDDAFWGGNVRTEEKVRIPYLELKNNYTSGVKKQVYEFEEENQITMETLEKTKVSQIDLNLVRMMCDAGIKVIHYHESSEISQSFDVEFNIKGETVISRDGDVWSVTETNTDDDHLLHTLFGVVDGQLAAIDINISLAY